MNIWGGDILLPPAGRALADIGLPAVGPLLEKIKSEGKTNMGAQCLIVFVYTLGPDLAEFRLEKAIAAETDEKPKQNLQNKLKLLTDHKLPGLLYKKRD